MALYVFGLILLVALIGFVAHRASVCTVRAILEVTQSGTAHMLASFVRAALWAALVFGALVWLTPAHAMLVVLEPRPLAVAGGFLFGLGSAINGACSFSTLQRVADGDLGGLATLAGMALGLLGWATLDVALVMTHPRALPVVWTQLGAWLPWLLAPLALLGVIELALLWAGRPRTSWRARAFAPRYRVATAGLVIGVIAGLLYALEGGWAYTATLRQSVDAAYRHVPGPSSLQWLLLGALWSGMVASAVQRRSFRLRWQPTRSLWPRLAGGTMMGAGSAMVPGGNDALLLTGLPAFSGWALIAYAALLAGVAVGLAILQRLGARLPYVSCEGGVCIERAA